MVPVERVLVERVLVESIVLESVLPFIQSTVNIGRTQHVISELIHPNHLTSRVEIGLIERRGCLIYCLIAWLRLMTSEFERWPTRDLLDSWKIGSSPGR